MRRTVARALFVVLLFLVGGVISALTAQAPGPPICRVSSSATRDSSTTVTTCTVAVRVDTVRRVDTVTVPAPAPEPTPEPTPEPPPPVPGSNEPSGFARLTASEPVTVPVYPTANGWGSYPYPSTKIRAVTTTTPSGDGSAFEFVFPKGFSSGAQVGKLWPRLTSTASRRLYVRFNVRLEGSSFEAEYAYTKLAFWGYARDPGTAKNDGIFGLSGSYTKGLAKQCWRIEYRQQNKVTRNLPTTGNLCAGQWARIEVYAALNTLGSANGKLKIWKDGAVILDKSDVTYIVPGYEYPFIEWLIGPVWGGNSGYTKAQEDRVRFDGIYVSGAP